jgi:dephospho-CoA kinase
MYIVGLTGGIGSGKSTAAKFFNELGITIVDADIIARQVVEPGQPSLQKITEHFGSTILQSNGSLDRGKLREIIFSQPEEKQWLESLLHPVIYQKAHKELHSAKGDYVIYMSPLIFESHQRNWCHRIVVIDIPEELQVERAVLRDHTNVEDIHRIISSQIPRTERLAKADDIIDNSSSREALKKSISALHTKLQKLAIDHRSKNIQ